MGVAETRKAFAVASIAEWLCVLAMVTAVLGLAAAPASPRAYLVWRPKARRTIASILLDKGKLAM